MRILVTGAGGYLGSWIAPRLQELGHEVVGYSRTSCPNLGLADWRTGDVSDADALLAATRGCEVVVHLAVQPQYRSELDPRSDLETNTLGTLQVLRAAKAAGVRRFLLASTSAVYGAAAGCLSEDTPLAPVTPYGVSKGAAEAYCGLFSRTLGLHTTILRMFQVFGHSRDGHLRMTVEGHFLRAVLGGHPPTIYGSPANAFDFVHVDDVLGAFELALAAELPSGLTLNVGSGKLTSLGQLAGWCLEAANMVTAPLLAAATSAEARPPQYADLTRIHHFLGYVPTSDLRAWVFDTVRQMTADRRPPTTG